MSAAQTLPVVMTRRCREQNNMVYELACSGSPLTIRVACRDDEPGATLLERWRVDARESYELGAIIVTACGPTRAAALDAVGRWWSSQEEALLLLRFDWSAIRLFLASAGAL